MIRFKTLATLLAVASLTVNFGLADLIDGFTGFVDEGRNQVLDAGWGAVFGILLPLGLLTQLRSARPRIAGLQQATLVALALAAAGIAGQAWDYLVVAAALAGACGVLLRLHPAGSTFLEPGRARPALLWLGAIVAAPAVVYAARMAAAQRRGLPPFDAQSNGLQHWSVMAALALVVVLLTFLAGLGSCGWRLPAWSAALACLAWGVSCLLAPPSAAASEGHEWALAAIGWAAAVVGAVLLEARREQPSAT